MKENYLTNKYGTRFKLIKLSNGKYITEFPLPGYDGMAFGFSKTFSSKQAALKDANKDE